MIDWNTYWAECRLDISRQLRKTGSIEKGGWGTKYCVHVCVCGVEGWFKTSSFRTHLYIPEYFGDNGAHDFVNFMPEPTRSSSYGICGWLPLRSVFFDVPALRLKRFVHFLSRALTPPHPRNQHTHTLEAEAKPLSATISDSFSFSVDLSPHSLFLCLPKLLLSTIKLSPPRSFFPLHWSI